MDWYVRLVPHSEYSEATGKNQSGLRVEITNDDDSKELCRVAFARRHAVNRGKGFKKVLLAKIDEAQVAADAINKHNKALEEAKRRTDALRREQELEVGRLEREHRELLHQQEIEAAKAEADHREAVRKVVATGVAQ